MPLTKSSGNMYPWVTHMHTHLGGKCSHGCSYCYVQKNRFGVSPKYQGELWLVEDELHINYGKDKTIFIEHMNDMFADAVPNKYIEAILEHCNCYPKNTYVFQTKNPARMVEFAEIFPNNIILGTTIETDLPTHNISKAPEPVERYKHFKQALMVFVYPKNFVTIEPIIRFDLPRLVLWLMDLNPSFINIGADSKDCNLPEPSAEDIKALIKAIQEQGIEIKMKHNLTRLLHE